MRLSATRSGVDFLRGRGKNASVAFSISFRSLERWARSNKLDTRRLMARSFARATGGLKRTLQGVMSRGGGVAGVPKFADFESFTLQLRARRGITSRKMGGVLAEKDKIVAYRRAGWQVIGWPDRLAEWAVRFQDAVGPVGTDPFADPRGRAEFHRLGIRYVPHAYVRKPRRVLPEPFGAHVRANLDSWARNIFYKDLARQMARTGGIS